MIDYETLLVNDNPTPQAASTLPNASPPQAKDRDFLVHNSNTYASSRSFANFTYCFPFLFPYGRGGYEEDRVVKLSEKAWFMRCLRVHGGAFQTHYGFIAMGYDAIATSLAYSAQYVAMRFTKRAINNGIINKDTVRLCLSYQAEIQSHKRRGLKVVICVCQLKQKISFYYTVLVTGYCFVLCRYHLRLQKSRI